MQRFKTLSTALLSTALLSTALLSTVSLVASSAASAAPVIDGAYDAEYGAAKSTVLFNPAAPDSNFGAPTNGSNTTAYSIFLTDQAGFYYGYLKAATMTGLPFANLYFDLDPQNGNGSDIVVEVTNSRAANPNNGVYGAIAGLQFIVSADGTAIEFKLPNSVFTAAIPGVVYENGQQFASNGSAVTLRLSQSFGYSVAGGATYGNDRLGSVTLVSAAAVPEPETLAILGLGLGALALSRRRAKSRAL